MLLDLFRSGFSREAVISLILFIPTILISLTVHEYCHGYAAYLCGDNTAKWNGRLTLNPIKHLDPIGTLMMLVFRFGYAKPVPVNSRNFKHYRLGLCFVAIAGPLANLLLAFIGMLSLYISMEIAPDGIALIYSGGFRYFDGISSTTMVWMQFILNFIFANIALAIFNLLPIPPLDGSRIISSVLPAKLAYYYNKYENYIMIAVFALLYTNVLDAPINFLTNGLSSAISSIFEMLPFFGNAASIINF